MAPLAGRVSVVLGASQGIGAAIARELARDGAAVMLCARRLDAVEAVAAGLRSEGLDAAATACDVTDPASVGAAVAGAAARFGRVDHVVNNAGRIDPIAPLSTADPAAWAEALRVNLLGTLHGMQAALRAFGPAGGVIVNLSSGAAHVPLEGWSAYCASKAAALMLMQVAAVELAGGPVRLYAFQPGAVDTGMLDTVRAAGMGYVARLPRADLLPPDLPARVVAWLMRDEAADLSGRELSIRDAGLRARAGLPEDRRYV